MPEIGTLPIKWLNDINGDRFFPVTNTKAVRDEHGNSLDSIISAMPDQANAGVLTIEKNGVTIGTFGANDSGDSTINITMATVAVSGSYSDLTGKPAGHTDFPDVAISTLSDGDILKYDAASSKWVNSEDAGGAEIKIRTWSSSNS